MTLIKNANFFHIIYNVSFMSINVYSFLKLFFGRVIEKKCIKTTIRHIVCDQCTI